MIPFICMVSDGGTEIFKVSASTAPFNTFSGVGATCFAIDLAKHFCAPPHIQSLDSLLELADIWDGIFVFELDLEATAKLI
ncbi:hypothetical protein BCCGELA001_28540 [Bradyrhizobium sp. CCGE-LA001]|nr:hypothetical protein BCCGELA001_28540 [Bradyrhizobium sp. CCGE-LA001]